MAAISEGEVAIYDRQLRLWGVKAQSRLLKSKVLVWGLEGSNIEVCKNLVLAGISLTVRDHRTVGKADTSFNYFLREEDHGKNRAECGAVRIQEMNPLNEVSSSTAAPEADQASILAALKTFDVVILGLGVLAWNVDRAREVNAACREAKVRFLLTVNAGETAFFFSDLQTHTVQEVSSAQAGAGGVAADAPAYEPETIEFASFGEWLECSPVELLKSKVDASIVLISLFCAFSRKNGGQVQKEDAAKFKAYCETIGCLPSVDGVASLEDAFSFFFVEPLMHVASIIGGLISQEVIKAITQRDPPMVNSVCFNAHTCAALVERIPALKKAAPKRKVEEVSLDLD